jgi:TPR repeat protein
MTLRKFGEIISDFFVDLFWNIKGLFNDTMYWFLDGYEKIISGNILDLTIWQAVIILCLAFVIIFNIKEIIENRKLFKSYMAGAKLGHAESQFLLGEMYYSEDCWVAPDMADAYKWITLAKANGYQGYNADIYLDKIKEGMTPDQIFEAQKLARRMDGVTWEGIMAERNYWNKIIRMEN